MSFYNFLKEYNFSEISQCLYNIGDYNLEYYFCSRSMDNKVFAKYIIIDLRNPNILKICNNTLLKSYEDFKDFQELHLAKNFFHDDSLLRYNTYLLFVYENYNNDLFDKICNDMDYARKIFLRKEDFENYFCFSRCISGIVKSNKSDFEAIENLKKIVKKLQLLRMKYILLSIDHSKIIDYFFSQNRRKSLDGFFMKDVSEKNFFENNFYKECPKTKDIVKIKLIKKILISNFRVNCFDRDIEITTGKVNVFYGENAIGKSSILDAIEFAFTGQTHKFLNDVSLSDAIVTLEDENKKKIISKNTQKATEEYKQNWYKFKMGSLNELFCRINYFDTDATYRFALEDGDSEEAFSHLKKLLCNGKLIEVEDNLIMNIEKLTMVEKFFKIHFKRIRKLHNNRNKYSIIKRLVYLCQFFLKKHPAQKPIDYSIKEQQRYTKIIDQQNDTLNEIKKIKQTCEDSLVAIETIMSKQIELSLKLINEIFHRLYSYDSVITWKNETFEMTNTKNQKKYIIKTMSTAQKVCLALSVIFAQFFIAKDAPRIILLDESVANFDSIHLLNLFDFLRDISLEGIQIFFTTASEDVAKISRNKFVFLNDDFNLYKLDKNNDAKAEITKIN